MHLLIKIGSQFKSVRAMLRFTYPGNSIAVFLDAVVSLFQTGRLKWWLAHKQSVPEREGEEVKLIRA